jgi:hypothetical protein
MTHFPAISTLSLRTRTSIRLGRSRAWPCPTITSGGAPGGGILGNSCYWIEESRDYWIGAEEITPLTAGRAGQGSETCGVGLGTIGRAAIAKMHQQVRNSGRDDLLR